MPQLRKISRPLARRAALATAIAALALTVDARANLVFDGDFEGDGAHAPNNGSYGLGSTYVPGWTVYARNGIYNLQWIVNGSYTSINAFDGVGLLDLTGNPDYGDAGVQQSFATTAGTAYKATFYLGYASRTQSFAGPVTAEVSTLGTSDNATLDDGEHKQRFTTSGADATTSTVWTPFEYDFTATSAFTLLRIEGISQGGVFLGLDAVDVELGPQVVVDPPVSGAVPEPAVLSLMGLGVLAMVSETRRRRKSETPR